VGPTTDMEPQDQELTGIHGCDENKCVSKGMSNLHNGSFTCYGDDGTFYPMMCADGFLPVIAEDEPPIVAADFDGSGDMFLTYFTCCPPYHLSSEATTDATRHCSDPITVSIDSEADGDESVAAVCDNQDTRKYPRQMKPNVDTKRKGKWSLTQTDSFLCCDNNTTIVANFIDDSECVPYRNKFYEAFKAQNEIGLLRPISCDFQEEDFGFPRPVGGETINDVLSTGRYRCCKNGPGLLPFVQDSAFKITVYPLLALNCISALVSAIVAIALLIPLLIQLKNRSSPLRRPELSTLTTKSSLSHSKVSSIRRVKKPRYSNYNLYLVYLAVLDLIYNLYLIGWFGKYINQKFDPAFYGPRLRVSNIFYGFHCWDKVFVVPYLFANLSINAIISYQVMILLRTSQSGRKINQPTLTKVNLHAGAVCFVSVIVGVIDHFLFDVLLKAINNGEFQTVGTIENFLSGLEYLTFILPFGYVICVNVLIWWRGYIPPKSAASVRNKAMRELAFYFYRIIAVFIGIWIPLVMFNVYSSASWANMLVGSLGAIQPILTTCMILTKSDARKYILDLVTLSYLFGNCTYKEDKTLPTGGNETAASKETSFAFAETDVDFDADVNADFNANADNKSDDSADAAIFNDDDNEGDGNESDDAAAEVQVSTSIRNQTRWITVLGTGDIVPSVSKLK
jgi:hypothetical protein